MFWGVELKCSIFWDHSSLCNRLQCCIILLAALSCNKFVYETVGNVIGMRRFKAHMQGTPGERIFLVSLSWDLNHHSQNWLILLLFLIRTFVVNDGSCGNRFANK